MKKTILFNSINSRENYNYDQKEYAYYVDEEFNISECAVVFVGSTLQIIRASKVKGLTKKEASGATKWIVQKINLKSYREKEAKEAIVQEIKNKLRKRREEMEEILIYKQLAQEDSEIKKLLIELETLTELKSIK